MRKAVQAVRDARGRLDDADRAVQQYDRQGGHDALLLDELARECNRAAAELIEAQAALDRIDEELSTELEGCCLAGRIVYVG